MEIRRRILMAKTANFAVVYLFKSRRILRKNKIIIYNIIVRPVLLFGREAWTVTNKAGKILDVFERKILRRILGST
jgi:hypothetical protein